MLRAQRADREAQAEVLRRYTRLLHRLVVTTCPAKDEHDLVQSLLARLLEVLPRFEPNGPAKLTTWVFTIAHRFLLDVKKRARPKLVAVEDARLEAPVDLLGGAWRAEVRTALERALKTLPDEQRRPLVLVHVCSIIPSKKSRRSRASPSARSSHGSSARASRWQQRSVLNSQRRCVMADLQGSDLELLEQYEAGTLSREARGAFEVDLEKRPELRAALAGARAVEKALPALREPTLDENRVEAIVQRALPAQGSSRTRTFVMFAAAAALLAFGWWRFGFDELKHLSGVVRASTAAR